MIPTRILDRPNKNALNVRAISVVTTGIEESINLLDFLIPDWAFFRATQDAVKTHTPCRKGNTSGFWTTKIATAIPNHITRDGG